MKKTGLVASLAFLFLSFTVMSDDSKNVLDPKVALEVLRAEQAADQEKLAELEKEQQIRREEMKAAQNLGKEIKEDNEVLKVKTKEALITEAQRIGSTTDLTGRVSDIKDLADSSEKVIDAVQAGTKVVDKRIEQADGLPKQQDHQRALEIKKLKKDIESREDNIQKVENKIKADATIKANEQAAAAAQASSESSQKTEEKQDPKENIDRSDIPRVHQERSVGNFVKGANNITPNF